MITPAQFDELLTPILALYDDFMVSVIKDIVRRLMKMNGMTASAEWQINRLLEGGAVYDDILDEFAILTGKARTVIEQMFIQAGITSLKFDNKIYQAAGLKPLPIPLSPAMQRVLIEGIKKTMGEVVNLTLTTAIAGQDTFVQALDLAYMQVTNGTMSYTQAIKEGVKHIADKGLSLVSYKHSKDQVDVAVRRAVLTGVSQTVGQIQLDGIAESGLDLVQTSAHIGARPTHEVWQGRVFSLTGKTPGYPLFDETGYGTGPGLAGWNCRHSFYPFYPGVSEELYSQSTLDEYAGKKLKYKGVVETFYEATQQQREIERNIRKVKREAAGLAAAGLDNTEEVGKVHLLQALMRDFIGQTGLVRQPVREGGKVEIVRGDK